jgi:hypothetical protein
MIVNHRYKFIFVKTRKTAGTSLECALSKYCDHKDILTNSHDENEELERTSRGYQGANPYPGLEAHAQACEIKEKLPNIWEDYTKFTIVRDPLEYAISEFFWSKHKNIDPVTQDTPNDFDLWAHRRLKAGSSDNWWIYTIKHKPCMDFYVRYEQLHEDLTKLSKVLDLPGDLGIEIKEFKCKANIRNNIIPKMTQQTKDNIYKWAGAEVKFLEKLKSI